MTTTQDRPRSSTSTGTSRTSRYAAQVSGLMLAAFGLSATYTVWSTATGRASDDFRATDPAVWCFYAAMAALALAVRRDRLVAWRLTVLVLPLLLAVGVLVYPTLFTAERQTTFGWFENDVYLGLLMTALYLSVQRLRGRRLEP
jgi:peptidoglycan/LPS O-acetylase OafA/YrhL